MAWFKDLLSRRWSVKSLIGEQKVMGFDYWRHSVRGWIFHFIGRNEAAFKEYSVAYGCNPSAKLARNLGFIAAEQNRLVDGAYWFEEATRKDPENAETWFNLGFALERNGQPQEAIRAFSESARLKPSIDRAWYGLGLAHARLGNHAEAARSLEETVRLQPMHGEAWYHLGMAHHFARNPDRVTEVIEKLKSFEPKRANQLIQDTNRTDLQHLYTEMPF